jgi:hypothetical protein
MQTVTRVSGLLAPAGRRGENENIMKKKNEKREQSDNLRREYDLSTLKGGVRGKYVARYRAGTNVVMLSPDVAEYFPDERSVNAALRGLIQVAKKRRRDER